MVAKGIVSLFLGLFLVLQTGCGTALSRAAGTGNINIVKSLLREGADVNEKDNDGWTALMSAGNYPEVARTLITAGADVNVSIEQGRLAGMTPLMLAVQKGQLDTVKILVDAGAKVNVKRNSDGETALMLAIRENPTIAHVLLDKGASVNDRRLDGLTALMLAAKAGEESVVKKLISYGAAVNVKTDFGWTALMAAVYSGSLGTVAALLNARAEVNAKTQEGNSALKFADRLWMRTKKTDYTQIARLLVRYGAKN